MRRAKATAPLGGDEAVEGDDTCDFEPSAAAIATMATSTPPARRLRIRVRRVVARAGPLRVTPPVKAAWRCQHVCDFRYADDMCRLVASERVLSVEDGLYIAEAIHAGVRLDAIAADVAADGDAARLLLSVNAYDIAVSDRDIPGPSIALPE
jgi:hypothetical protein